MGEIEERINAVGSNNIDYITLVGNGEPLLFSGIGELVRRIKSSFSHPVAVITNGALFFRKDVRADLKSADVILPTLDAGSSEMFLKINRPHPSIDFREMVEGMVRFREEFSGEVWMEFMAVEGMNNSVEELERIRNVLERIQPSRLYINVPIRPPAEGWVRTPNSSSLRQIQRILGECVSIHLPENGEFYISGKRQARISSNEDDGNLEPFTNDIMEIIKRHPMRMEQVIKTLTKKGIQNPQKLLDHMVEEGTVGVRNYLGKKFCVLKHQ